MNVVVCVKQIPDPAAPQSLDSGSYNLNRSGKLILDEADTYGVEMALQLTEKAGGGEVTVVSMGSAADLTGIRNALAMGASSAVVVSDDSLRGSDALAAAIGRTQYDLILCATESSDGYTGTLPVQLAEVLGLPSVTFAKSVTVEGGQLSVQRQTEAGYDDVVCPLPAVVSVTAGVVEPRYASFKGIMAAKSKPVDQPTAADLGVAAGAANAGQKIVTVEAAEARQAGEKHIDDGDGADKIVAFLESIKVL